MTMGDSKETATKNGNALVKKLGKKWRIRVWDNLGWHSSAQFSGTTNVQVFQYGNRYTVYLNTNPQIVVHGDDAVDTVMIAVARLNNKITELQTAADELKGCV